MTAIKQQLVLFKVSVGSEDAAEFFFLGDGRGVEYPCEAILHAHCRELPAALMWSGVGVAGLLLNAHFFSLSEHPVTDCRPDTVLSAARPLVCMQTHCCHSCVI